MLANININLPDTKQPPTPRGLPVYDWRSSRAGDMVRATKSNYTDISRVNMRKSDRVSIMKRYQRAGLSSGAIANKLGELAKAFKVAHYWEIAPAQMSQVYALIDRQLFNPVPKKKACTISEVVDNEDLVMDAIEKIAGELLELKRAIKESAFNEDLEVAIKKILKA